jgi:hypothetical protein
MHTHIEKRVYLYSEVVINDTADGFELLNRGRLMSRWDSLGKASIERERVVETIAQMSRLRELQHETRRISHEAR